MLREVGEMRLLVSKEIRVRLGYKLVDGRRWLGGQVKRRLFRVMGNKRDIIVARIGIAIINVVKTAATTLVARIRLICLVVLLFGVWLEVAQKIGRHTGLRGQWSSGMGARNAVQCYWRIRIFIDVSSEMGSVSIAGRLDGLNVTVRVCLHKHISIGWKHSRNRSNS